MWTDEEVVALIELVHTNNIGTVLHREQQQTANANVCQFKDCILWPTLSVKATWAGGAGNTRY